MDEDVIIMRASSFGCPPSTDSSATSAYHMWWMGVHCHWPANAALALTEVGRLFQARAATTGNARSPSVERLVDLTTIVGRSADRR